MIVRISKDGFNEDSVAGWKESLSHDSKPFVFNRNNLPIDVFFTVIVTTTPVFMTLSGASDRPVSCLTFFRAVGPLLAAATLLDKRTKYFFQAEGTVPDFMFIILNYHRMIECIQNI